MPSINGKARGERVGGASGRPAREEFSSEGFQGGRFGGVLPDGVVVWVEAARRAPPPPEVQTPPKLGDLLL